MKLSLMEYLGVSVIFFNSKPDIIFQVLVSISS